MNSTFWDILMISFSKINEKVEKSLYNLFEFLKKIENLNPLSLDVLIGLLDFTFNLDTISQKNIIS